VSEVIRCAFYERQPAEGGGYRYRRVRLRTPDAAGSLPTTFDTPTVGDLVWLWEEGETEPRGCAYVVVSRGWSHPAWGSMNWPHGASRPTSGTWLDVVVEHEPDGLFADEADEDEDEDEDNEEEDR
jgi:hypothetical protein